jgi:hypothetical protein
VSHEEKIAQELLVKLDKADSVEPRVFISFNRIVAIGEEMQLDQIEVDDLEVEYAVELLLQSGSLEPREKGEVDKGWFRITPLGKKNVAAYLGQNAEDLSEAQFVEYKSMGAPSGHGPYETGNFGATNEGIKPYDAVITTSSSEPEIQFDPAVESVNWTGKRLILVDAQAIEDLRKMARELQSAVYALRMENNFESSNLKGLADALVCICDMAEPETTIIERILANPKFKAYAGILGIVSTIRGVFNF